MPGHWERVVNKENRYVCHFFRNDAVINYDYCKFRIVGNSE